MSLKRNLAQMPSAKYWELEWLQGNTCDLGVYGLQWLASRFSRISRPPIEASMSSSDGHSSITCKRN